MQIDNNLLKTVEKYIEMSEFYQHKYKGHSISRFIDIPTIRKGDLLLDQAENAPFGSNVCVSRDKIARLHRTSGTSNKALLLTLTKQDVAYVVEAGSRALKLAGMGPNDIVVNCMNYCMWMGGFMDHLSIEATGAAAVPYGVGHTENLIEILMDIESPSLHSTPSYLNVIKKVLFDKYGKHPDSLGLVKGFFGGESGMQDQSFRDKIEQEWGMKAFNANYGMSEAISIMASECGERNGLHFTAGDILYAELRDLDTDSTSSENIKEGRVGELVITNLYKESQPLIRYCTGDVIQILSTSHCNCGEDSFTFKVCGRCDDMIVIKGINFYPESLRAVISKYPQCTGNYKVQVPSGSMVEEIKLIVEVQKCDDGLKLISELEKDIKHRLFISPTIELTNEIKSSGNKIKMVERV